MNNQYSTTINDISHDTSDDSIALDTNQANRNRSWRRFQAYKNKGKILSVNNRGRREGKYDKAWVCLNHKGKMKRAIQLGREHKRRPMHEFVGSELQNVID